MGAAIPVILPSIVSTAVKTVVGAQKENRVQSQASVETEAVRQQQTTDEDARQRALKASVSRQRARFGAAGINAEEGSAEAVLLGLFEESDAESQARSDRDSLREKAINQSASSSRGRNLLDTTGDVLGSVFSRTFLS